MFNRLMKVTLGYKLAFVRHICLDKAAYKVKQLNEGDKVFMEG